MSHIPTILYSNSGCACRPGYMKNFKSPQFRKDTRVAWSLSVAWSFASCSLSFHSNMMKFFPQNKRIFSHFHWKFSSLEHQHDCLWEIVCFNTSTTLVTCVDNAPSLQFGCVATRPPLAGLQRASLWETAHYQRDPTVSGPRWNAIPKRETLVDREIRFSRPYRAWNPP